MRQDWTWTRTEDGESLDESFESVFAPSSFLPPIALSPYPQEPPLPGKPVLAVATKQLPPPPLTSEHRPKRLVSQPRSSVGSFASQGSTPSPAASGVNFLVLTRTPSASGSSLSLTLCDTRLSHCPSHPSPLLSPPCTHTHRDCARALPQCVPPSQTGLPSLHKAQQPPTHPHPPVHLSQLQQSRRQCCHEQSSRR